MWKSVYVASRTAFAFAFLAAAWSPAGAADLGTYDRSYKDYGDPIVVPAGYFSWTGFYIGAHLGYGWGSTSVEGSSGAFSGPVSGFDLDPSGWIGGGTIGYNWQTDSFVFGVEGDLGYIGAEDSAGNAFGFANTEYGGYGTLTGRIGYSENRWLFYAKGGLALAEIDTEAGALTAGGAIDASDYTQEHDIETGWALGVGVEHAFQQNMSLKVEYLYMDFGEYETGNFDGDVFDHENDIHTLKVGFNYSLQRVREPLK